MIMVKQCCNLENMYALFSVFAIYSSIFKFCSILCNVPFIPNMSHAIFHSHMSATVQISCSVQKEQEKKMKRRNTYFSCVLGVLPGCPIYMTKEEVYDKLEPLSQKEKEIICSTLFYCINWFIEVRFLGLNDSNI